MKPRRKEGFNLGGNFSNISHQISMDEVDVQEDSNSRAYNLFYEQFNNKSDDSIVDLLSKTPSYSPQNGAPDKSVDEEEKENQILIVDDNPMNIYVVEEMLKVKSIGCESATSGRLALNMIQERIENVALGQGKMFKLILLDYSMPEMDGPQVATAIVAMFRNNPLISEDNIPYICCCTAYSGQTFMNTAFDAGMNHFLTKPLDFLELDELLHLLD